MAELKTWAKTRHLCEGLAVTRNRLYEMRLQGRLVEGEHFRVDGAGANAPVVWHVARVEQALIDASSAVRLHVRRKAPPATPTDGYSLE
jgi:hypothetical protein